MQRHCVLFQGYCAISSLSKFVATSVDWLPYCSLRLADLRSYGCYAQKLRDCFCITNNDMHLSIQQRHSSFQINIYLYRTGLSNIGLCTIVTSFYFRLYNLTAILSLKLSSQVVLNLSIVTSVYDNCIGIHVKYTCKCMNIKFICMNVLSFFFCCKWLFSYQSFNSKVKSRTLILCVH